MTYFRRNIDARLRAWKDSLEDADAVRSIEIIPIYAIGRLTAPYGNRDKAKEPL